MMLLALVATALAAQAAPHPPDSGAGGTAAAAAAEQVARAAQLLRGDATIATTLQTVQVGKHNDAKQALAALGFATALDLRLLAGGPEAVELMAALQSGGLGIADRAKIRLLVSMAAPVDRTRADHGEQVTTPGHRRQLQDQDTDRSTLSADTIAIVLSVIVGVCGYLLQAWTSDKASRHAGDLQREHDQQTRDMQVEQDRTQGAGPADGAVGGRLLRAGPPDSRRVFPGQDQVR